MKVDLYESCPCGSGKKIKFCCKDLAREIESLMTKIEGKQVASAQAQLEKLLAEDPDRECWLAIKATLQLQMGDLEAAQSTLDHFLEIAPQNSIALAILAMIKASTPPETAPDEESAPGLSPEAKGAIDALQQSLENCGESLPLQIYDAVGAVGERLLVEGQVLGAREHFVFQAALSPEESTEAVNRVMQIDGATDVPTLLKQDLLLQMPPEDDRPWKSAYEAIFEFGQRGQWGNALEATEAAIKQFPDEPFFHRAQGVLGCRLGDSETACKGWNNYARIDGIDHDEAVEAAALAQVLSPLKPENTIDMIEVTCTVADADAALEKFQADKRCIALGLDFNQMGGDGPPPKAGFAVLDREMPKEVAEDVAIESLPQLVTQVLLYGKETDKDARILYSTYDGQRADEARSLFNDIIGAELKQPSAPDVLGQVSAGALETRFQTQLPQNTPPLTRNHILNRVRSHIATVRWPAAPNDLLDGKTPKEASKDEKLRVPLEAAILLMETTDGERETNEDFVVLRKSLGLAEPESPEVDDLRRVPLLKSLRLDATTLDNDQLRSAFVLAMQKAIRVLIMRFGRELLTREMGEKGFKRDELLGVLAKHASDPDEALSFVQEAQRVAVKRGDSPAAWKVNELGMRLMRGEANEFQTLLANIQSNHLKEPGIQQLLVQQLTRFGLIRPGGEQPGGVQSSGVQPTIEPATVGAPGPDVVTGQAEADESSGDAEGGKSKLWLPGMD